MCFPGSPNFRARTFYFFSFQYQPRRIQHFDEIEIRADNITLRYIVERPKREIHHVRQELFKFLQAVFLKTLRKTRTGHRYSSSDSEPCINGLPGSGS